MLTRNILFLLTITNLFSTVHATNEDLRFEHLTLEQGQAQSRVQAILQDRTGFMWFGTDDGLNRYDGYSFVVYRYEPENPSSLSDNTVWSLCEDSSGVLWIGTSSGLSKFLRETDEFINYELEHVESRRGQKNPARIIFVDSFGKLWLGSSGGLVQHIPETGEFIYYRHDPGDEHSLSHNVVFTIFEDRSGRLWVGTHNGLNRFERQTGNFVRYYIPTEEPDRVPISITSIAEGRGGNLWIGTTGGLSQFDREEGKFMVDTPEFLKATASEERVIFTIQEDRRGRIWFGGGWGLAQLDPISDDLTVFNNDPKDQFSLSNDFVISIYEDRSGVLWIGTRNGINRLDPRKSKFKNYTFGLKDSKSTSNNVRAIYQDGSGTLWLGTSKGLVKYDRISRKVTHYNHDPNDSKSLGNDQILTIAADSAGVLWVGTVEGLNEFDRKKGVFKRHQIQTGASNIMGGNFVYTIHQDRAGSLWIGTLAGLGRFDPATSSFTELYQNQPENPPHSLSNNSVLFIYEDRFGILWIGTNDGLNRIDRKKSTITHFRSEPGNPNSLSNNKVYSIYEDRMGGIWVGTAAGLNRFDRAEERFTRYTQKDGLASGKIHSILEDANGNLWLSTNSGLTKFRVEGGFKDETPPRLQIRNYDESDGLGRNQLNINASWYGENGEMFFGGMNGLTAFHPDSVTSDQGVPPIVLTSFKKFNQPVKLDTAIYAIKELALTHRDYAFSFEFAALDLTAPQKNRFAYKLEGLDKNWIDLGTKHDITFTNLDAGEYIFRVKGSNNAGVWNEEGASVKIIITPPYWQTWWFRVLSFIMIIALVFTAHRMRTKSIEARNRALQKEIDERQQAEKAMQQSEERLKLATEATQLGTYDWHPLENKVHWDERMHELFGLSPRSRKDRNDYFLSILHPDDSEQVAGAMQSFMNPKNKESSFKDEYRIVLKNGVKHIATQGFGFRNENGEVSRIIGTCLDITEHKQAQEALQESEERFRKLSESAFEGIAISDKGRILDVNEQLSEMLRINLDDLIGMNAIDFVAPESRELVEQHIKSGSEEPYEHFAIRKDGSIFRVEVRAKTLPYEGQMLRVTAIRDVTERKQAEEALIKNEQLLSSIINNTSAVIYVKAVDGRYLLINKQYEKLFNVTLEEIEGKTDYDIFPKENADAFRAHDLQVIEEGSAIESEEVAPHPDGPHTYISIKFPLFDSTGNIYATCGISTDITERKLAEETNLSRLRLVGKRQAAMVKLATHPAVVSGDLKRANQVITQTSAEVFEIERVSIWFLSEDGHELRCIDLFERSHKKHSADTVLLAKDYPRYFEALKDGRAIDASDARTDPRTNEFLEGYLIPLGITSMLDAAIRVSGKVIGVVCHEQVGSTRSWIPEETTFAGEIADQVVQVLVNAERKQAEMALRKSEAALAEAQRITHVGSWSIDVATGKITWSDEMYRIHGITKETFDGNFATTLNWIHPDDHERILALHKKLYTEHIPTTDEYRITLPDGSIRTLFGRGEVEFDKDGRPLRYYGIVQDITERKDAEQALQQSQQQLRALADHLQSVREEERTAIAREMHDELGQVLTALKMDLTMMETELQSKQSDPSTQLSEIKRMKGVIDNTIVKVRTLIQELRPEVLDNLGLIPALEWQAEEFNTRTDIDYKFNSKVRDINIPKETATAVFRIFQETLTNIARHSKATYFEVNISIKNEHLFLKIADNGVGIPANKIENSKTFGLLGMKERALILGGKVEIWGNSGKGTTVTTRIPI